MVVETTRLSEIKRAMTAVMIELPRRLPEMETNDNVAAELAPLPNLEQRPSITSFPCIREALGRETRASSLHGSNSVYLIARQAQNRNEPIITSTPSQSLCERLNRVELNSSAHRKKKKTPSLINRPSGRMIAQVTQRVFLSNTGARKRAENMVRILCQKDK